eukprot:gene19225-biopygen22021
MSCPPDLRHHRPPHASVCSRRFLPAKPAVLAPTSCRGDSIRQISEARKHLASWKNEQQSCFDPPPAKRESRLPRPTDLTRRGRRLGREAAATCQAPGANYWGEGVDHPGGF